MRLLLRFGPLLALALLLASCGFRIPSAAEPTDVAPPAARAVVEGVSEGDRLPDAEFVTLSGERVRLSDFAGQPVMINFWATWCGPCVAEIPQLQATYNEHNGAGLQMLGVTSENADLVRTFVTDRKMTYPVVIDPGGKTTEAYRISGTPTTFFLDRNGVIITRHLGPIGENTLKIYLDDIMQSSPSSPPPARPAAEPTAAPAAPTTVPAPQPTTPIRRDVSG